MGSTGEGSNKVSDKKKCDYCLQKGTRDELKDHWKPSFREHIGTNEGDRKKLIKSILGVKKVEKGKHPLHEGVAPQAHHLICSEAMRDNKDWEDICINYGYDINCKENGVFLPSVMKLACHLKIPLHKGGHSAGYGDDVDEGESKSYPNAVKKKLQDLKKDIDEIKQKCKEKPGEKIIKKLNDLSSEIFKYVSEFTWTITYDGFDYQKENMIGCANCSSVKEKKELFITKLKGIEIDQHKRLPSDFAKIKKAKRKVLQEIFCEGDDGFGNRNHGSSFEIQNYNLTISK